MAVATRLEEVISCRKSYNSAGERWITGCSSHLECGKDQCVQRFVDQWLFCREELPLAEAAPDKRFADEKLESPRRWDIVGMSRQRSLRELIHWPWIFPTLALFWSFPFGACAIYYLGFIYLGSFLGLPVDSPLLHTRWWPWTILIAQYVLVYCVSYKFLIGQFPPCFSVPSVFLHIVRSLAKAAFGLLILPVPIVLIVTMMTYVV